ncbi:MAG: helicase associated domain-containing protein [Alphaproteobacteria bacterium]
MTVLEAELVVESADDIRLYGAKFARKLALLREYKRRYGHASPPHSHLELGNWVGNLRKSRKGKGKICLTPERIAALNALGFVWDAINFRWGLQEKEFKKKLALLRKYKRRYGHASPPMNYPRLGTWVSNVRQAHKGKNAIRLTPERIAALNALGFVWDMRKK